MKLYFGPRSGNAFKVRILLSLLGVTYEKVAIDFAKNEHKQPAFLKISPRGQVPAIVDDDGKAIWDSAACLVYVARKYGNESWLPIAPSELGEVMQWLALAGNEIQFGLQYARREALRANGSSEALKQYQAIGDVALNALESRLSSNEWLALSHPTIADVACFPYVNSAPEGKISLDSFPGVMAWLARCKALPGWLAP